MHTRSTHTRRLSLCYTPNASRGETSAGGSSSMRTVAQPHLRPGGNTSQADYRVRIRRPRSLISSTKLTDACSTLPSHENDCFGGRGEGWSSERERLRAQPHCQDRCATWHGTRVPPTWPARPRPWPTAAAVQHGRRGHRAENGFEVKTDPPCWHACGRDVALSLKSLRVERVALVEWMPPDGLEPSRWLSSLPFPFGIGSVLDPDGFGARHRATLLQQ